MTMRRWLSVLGFWVALSGLAQAAAVVWSVITPQQCTGAQAPVLCCQGSKAADNYDFCNLQTTFGHKKAVVATFNPDGGTYTNGGTFATNGDALSAVQFKRLGLDTVLEVVCDTGLSGRLPVLVGNRSLKIHMFNSGGVETPNLTVMVAGTTAASPGDQFSCLIIGY